MISTEANIFVVPLPLPNYPRIPSNPISTNLDPTHPITNVLLKEITDLLSSKEYLSRYINLQGSYLSHYFFRVLVKPPLERCKTGRRKKFKKSFYYDDQKDTF